MGNSNGMVLANDDEEEDENGGIKKVDGGFLVDLSCAKLSLCRLSHSRCRRRLSLPALSFSRSRSRLELRLPLELRLLLEPVPVLSSCPFSCRGLL